MTSEVKAFSWLAFFLSFEKDMNRTEQKDFSKREASSLTCSQSLDQHFFLINAASSAYFSSLIGRPTQRRLPRETEGKPLFFRDRVHPETWGKKDQIHDMFSQNSSHRWSIFLRLLLRTLGSGKVVRMSSHELSWSKMKWKAITKTRCDERID